MKTLNERLDDLIKSVEEFEKANKSANPEASEWRAGHEEAGHSWHHALDEAMHAHAPHGIDPYDTHNAVKDFKEGYPEVSHADISRHIKHNWPEAHPHLPKPLKKSEDDPEELEKMAPIVGAAVRGAAMGAATSLMDKGEGKKEKTTKNMYCSEDKNVEQFTGEILEKPPVSEAQRKAMHAAASGKSTLDIPKSVAQEFVAEDKGGKLPEKAKKEKIDKVDLSSRAKGVKEKEAPDLGQYWKQPLSTPASKTPTAASIDYSGGAKNPKVTPRAPKPSTTVPTSTAPKTALDEIKERQKMKKSEVMGKITSETLTKSMLQNHQPKEIEAMLRAGVDEGKLHRNILLEFQNFGTVNTAVLGLASDEE